MTATVAVIGARGYTGSELLPLLWRHPDFELVAVGSHSAAGKPVSGEVSGLEGCELAFSDITPERIKDHPADAYVLALPNGQAGTFVEAIEADCQESVIVDLSADYRFSDGWAYGLAERFEDAISKSKRIANPGCYATGMQLAIAPIGDHLRCPPVVFGVSGYSGAGRTPSRRNDPQVLKDNLQPYALAGHMHEREATRHLGHEVRFLPHVADFFRGINLTIAAVLKQPLTVAQLQALYEDAWRGRRLISVQTGTPEVAEVQGRHGAIIGGFTVSESSPGYIALVCVLDNLLKGAATQAVQNLNLAFGLDPLTGIAA